MQSYGILNGAGADMEPVPDTNHFRVFTEMRAHMDSLKVTGKEPFRIVLEEAQGEIEEKKSRFIATIRPIETEEEALQVVEQLKKKYWDARHNCYAYILQGANPVVRCSDDGEPQGTAGRPMLEVLTGANLQGVVAVVTRYFGGTLLGTGGLVRAYTAAVQEGLAHASIRTMRYGVVLHVETDYMGLGKLQYLFGQQGMPILDSAYTDVVTLTVQVPMEKRETVIHGVTEATAGKAVIREEDPAYYQEAEK